MKFMLDMGISPKTAVFLRNLGYDAIHLHDLKSDRSTDPAVMQMARNEERILLTHDLDFGELIAASGANAPSVIIFRLRNMNPKNVNRFLNGIISEHRNALEKGAIVSVTEGQVRVRLLPLNAPSPR
jgi:predicted nuclease of predicted toxin-antitoxin system